MKTLFSTGWQKDLWTPQMGQATSPGFWDIVSQGVTGATTYLEQEAAEEARKAREAEAEALRIKQQTLQIQQQAQQAQSEKILGLSPTTALIVGGLGLAAIVGIIMVSKS